MKKWLLVLVCTLVISGSYAQAISSSISFEKSLKTLNIKDFGAVGDSLTINTKAIQDAIDACTSSGGGTVWVPAGNYVIGTIKLKSNVTLSLDYGASLLGSTNPADYPIKNLRPAREGQAECLFYAEDATNIRFEGLGVIDTLENIEISYPGGGTKNDTERVIAEDIAKYPEQFFFGVLPAWGAYIRHAKNIEFKNVKMTTRSDDKREKIILDDVEGFVNH